jgi:hypothetical protein
MSETKALLSSERIEGLRKNPRAENVASNVLAGFGRINATNVWSGSRPEPVDALLRDCFFSKWVP